MGSGQRDGAGRRVEGIGMESNVYKSQISTQETGQKNQNKVQQKNNELDEINHRNSEKFFEKRICTINDVSLYTGYSIGTLYNLTSQNLIPHRKKRGRLFFVPTEILNWIDEGD